MTKNILENLDAKSKDILRAIGVMAEGKGVNAYLVGGVVRDLALGVPAGDLDVTVEGNGISLARAYAQAHDGTLVTYPSFGTATVTLPGGQLIDFASARKETYARPGAFPSVTFSHIEDDLFRRDFTINAMAVAINPKTWGKLVDPFNGMKDVRAGKIRVLHPGSFIDDPTRIARAARFMGRFGFAAERATAALIKEAVEAGALSTVKIQRHLKEIQKINKEKNGKAALAFLKTWDALDSGGK